MCFRCAAFQRDLVILNNHAIELCIQFNDIYAAATRTEFPDLLTVHFLNDLVTLHDANRDVVQLRFDRQRAFT